jgi:hypothetical protein
MTVRDSITRTRARTPGAEDDPTSTTVRDRALGPTQCGISDVATKRTKGGRKPNICRCMLGAVLSWRGLGRHRLRCQPCSRIGENPPYEMIGGIEETSASSKPDPRLDPTRLRGACDETHVPTATTPAVHHAARRRGGVAACGTRAAVSDADDWVSDCAAASFAAVSALRWRASAYARRACASMPPLDT